MNVFYEAEKVGNVYRGLVINSRTFDRITITAHTYSDRTTAVEAARRMHIEATPEEVQPFLKSWLVAEH